MISKGLSGANSLAFMKSSAAYSYDFSALWANALLKYAKALFS